MQVYKRLLDDGAPEWCFVLVEDDRLEGELPLHDALRDLMGRAPVSYRASQARWASTSTKTGQASSSSVVGGSRDGFPFESVRSRFCGCQLSGASGSAAVT